MNTYTQKLIPTATVSAILFVSALGVTVPTPAADAPTTTAAGPSAATEKAAAEKYDHEALTLEAKADRDARMAALYRARSSGGSKQQVTFWTLANRSERLATAERDAARTARNTATMHRKLASAE